MGLLITYHGDFTKKEHYLSKLSLYLQEELTVRRERKKEEEREREKKNPKREKGQREKKRILRTSKQEMEGGKQREEKSVSMGLRMGSGKW